MVPQQPMRRWNLSFEGKMRNEKTGSVHHVKISAVYTSELPYFDFDSEMEAWTVARAMAREPWSRAYFERLKAAHQNHYEQFGDVRGVIEVDGEQHQLDVQVRMFMDPCCLIIVISPGYEGSHSRLYSGLEAASQILLPSV